MQLTFLIKRASAGVGGICALIALAACSDGSARPAAGAAAPAAAGGSAKSYYLVIQTRPENLQKIFKTERWAYGLCAAAAKLKKIPVKPFPTLPDDFVFERNIYASDGTRTYVKDIQFKIDDASVEQGCAYKLASLATTDIEHDGKARMTQQNEEGVLSTGEDMAADTEPVSQSKLASYTASKVINGVQLKCKATGCIVDPALVVIAQGRRPVIAATRFDDLTVHGTALVTEPVSLSLGKPIDLSEFKQENGK